MNINGYFTPDSLPEAIGLLEENRGSARIIAGGTDVIVRAKRGAIDDCSLIDITRIAGLRGISVDLEGKLHIGACAKLTEILESPLVLEKAPVLAEAAGKVGSVQIRNMATMGGNIANASPSAETAPPLLVLGASVLVTGPGGDRKILMSELFSGPGKTCLEETEIIREFVVPSKGAAGTAYVKHSRRVVMDLATVNCAVKLLVDLETGSITDAVVAMGAVAPTPLLLPEVADGLKGSRAETGMFPQLISAAMRRVSPIADVRASLEYRTEMVGVVLKNAVREAYQKALAS